MATATGPTLTDMTQFGRQAVKVLGIGLVVMIVGRFALTSFVAFWKAINPPPPPPPTVGFGLLPQLRFSAQAEVANPTQYVLELPRGSFPDFGDRAKVFFMPLSSLSLLSDQNAKTLAAKHGFVFEPAVLSSRLYRWTKSTPLETTLQMDIQTLQLRLTTNYLNRPDLLLGTKVPEAAQAEQVVKTFLKVSGITDASIASSSAQASYLKLQGTELVDAVSYSDADFVQIYLNRYPIDGQFEMYTPDGTAIIKAIVAGGLTGNNSIVDLTSNFHPVDLTQVHTYPIRTPLEAWNILQAGEGYVARFEGQGKATIRGVTLGYYDDFEEQSYLQPIYVFFGDDSFLGYVPALDPRYIQPVVQ